MRIKTTLSGRTAKGTHLEKECFKVELTGTEHGGINTKSCDLWINGPLIYTKYSFEDKTHLVVIRNSKDSRVYVQSDAVESPNI